MPPAQCAISKRQEVLFRCSSSPPSMIHFLVQDWLERYSINILWRSVINNAWIEKIGHPATVLYYCPFFTFSAVKPECTSQKWLCYDLMWTVKHANANDYLIWWPVVPVFSGRCPVGAVFFFFVLFYHEFKTFCHMILIKRKLHTGSNFNFILCFFLDR